MSLLFALAVMSISAYSAVQTNQWAGAASGGSWRELTNWRVLPNGGNPDESALTAGGCVWDFSTLADGATVTDDISNLVIGGLQFGENQGTLTLDRGGSETISCTSAGDTTKYKTQIAIPSGTTVNFKLVHNATWAEHSLNLEGEGAFRFLAAYWGDLPWTVNLTDVTFVYGKDAYPDAFTHVGSFVFKTAKATLKLERNVTINAIRSDTTAVHAIDLNGFALTIKGAQSDRIYCGEITGDANTVLTLNGIPMSFWHDLSFSGLLNLGSGDAIFGKPEAPASLIGTPAFCAGNMGQAQFFASQSFRSLTGAGRESGIDIAEGKVVTAGLVGSQGKDSFGGRITGGGGFAKDGAEYTLKMTGANAYQGGTHVKAGELTLSRPLEAEGLVAYYDFDDDPSDATIEDKTFASPQTMSPMYSDKVATHDDCGPDGSRCLRFRDSQYEIGKSCNGYRIPIKDKIAPSGDFTFLVWIRVDPATDWAMKGKSKVANILYTGNWAANNVWFHLRQNTVYFGACSGTDVSYATPTDNQVADGNWHQVGVAGSANEGKRWIVYDGEYVREQSVPIAYTNPNDLYLGALAAPTKEDDREAFNGWMDSFSAWNRKLSADEVKKAFDRRAIVARPVSLPKPVAHWTFDAVDGDKVIDQSGNGHDFSVSECSLVTTAKGSHGNVLYASASSSAATASFPSEITGNHDFTFSCRYHPRASSEKTAVIGLGDYTTANKFIAICNQGYPGKPTILYSDVSSASKSDIEISDHRVYSKDDRCGWLDLVCVYSAKAQRVDVFLGGVGIASKTGVNLNLGANGVYIGQHPKNGAALPAYFDDVRVYDVAFTSAQVAELARSIRPDADENVISSASPVTVDAGATLTVDAPKQSIASLAGAGKLRLSSAATLTLGGVSNFTGGISGGELVLEEDFAFDLSAEHPDSIPLASTGVVRLPAKAKVVMDGTVEKRGTYKIVSAGKLVPPADFTAWTFEPMSNIKNVQFNVVDNFLTVTVRPYCGTVLVVR